MDENYELAEKKKKKQSKREAGKARVDKHSDKACKKKKTQE